MKKLPIVCASILAAATALAGPPLICYGYRVPDPSLLEESRYVGKDKTPLPGVETEILRLLDQEETLVRMAVLREVVMREGVWELVEPLLERRAAYAKGAGDPKRAASTTFDLAYGRATRDNHSKNLKKQIPLLQEAVLALNQDPAAWLGLARAGTPLVSSATLEEHARAFVKAWDLSQASPKGIYRDCLLKNLEGDLGTLEAYLLDRGLPKEEATPEGRLAHLRKLASDFAKATEKK